MRMSVGFTRLEHGRGRRPGYRRRRVAAALAAVVALLVTLLVTASGSAGAVQVPLPPPEQGPTLPATVGGRALTTGHHTDPVLPVTPVAPSAPVQARAFPAPTGPTAPGATSLPPAGTEEAPGQTCFVVVDKVQPGQSVSDVLASGCRPAADTSAPQLPAEAAAPSTGPTRLRRDSAPAGSPSASAGSAIPIIELYANANYGGKSFIVYGYSGPCDGGSGYNVSDATNANSTVGGISSSHSYNGCSNESLYNQTQLAGTPARYYGPDVPSLPAAYDNKVYSLNTRANCTTYSQTGYSVCGRIRDDYDAVGGPSGFLGYPTSNELTNPDGVGKRNSFANTGAIYWTPATDAHAIQGSVLQKWGQVGYETGVLGYPMQDQCQEADGVGVFTAFFKNNTYAAATTVDENGDVEWNPSTGAHEVHGAIQDKWIQVDNVAGVLGYPATDETATSDNGGRQNLFFKNASYEAGTTVRTNAAVIFSSATGAREVHGAIYGQYAGMGDVRSCHRYPITDVQAVSRGESSTFSGTNNATTSMTFYTDNTSFLSSCGENAFYVQSARLRADFGLRADRAWIQQVAADSTSRMDRLGVPLTPAETDNMTNRSRVLIPLGNSVENAGAQTTSYAGEWVDQAAGGVLHVGMVNPSSADLARMRDATKDSNAVIDLVGVTKQALNQKRQTVANMAKNDQAVSDAITDWSTDWQGNRVEVTLKDGSDPALAGRITAATGQDGVSVVYSAVRVFAETRDAVTGPIFGGARTNKCTVAFSNLIAGGAPHMLTAGHCTGEGTDGRTFFRGDTPVGQDRAGRPAIGSSVANNSDIVTRRDSTCDCQIVKLNRPAEASSRVYLNDNDTYPYRNTADPMNYMPAMDLCFSGGNISRSQPGGGIVCGKVIRGDYARQLADANPHTILSDQVLTDIRGSFGGDSGGAYGNGPAFLGVHAGGLRTEPKEPSFRTFFSKSTTVAAQLGQLAYQQ